MVTNISLKNTNNLDALLRNIKKKTLDKAFGDTPF